MSREVLPILKLPISHFIFFFFFFRVVGVDYDVSLPFETRVVFPKGKGGTKILTETAGPT